MSSEGLVYIGKVVDVQPIEGADFIASATVVCGKGGKWSGVIRKMDIHLGESCVVFLPDSQLSPEIHFWMTYMKDEPEFPVGTDITERMRVVKYHKPVPAHLQGIAKGPFPGFIPKTDEPNYQNMEGQEHIDGFAFSGYKIDEHRYLTFWELLFLLKELKFPMVEILSHGESFNKEGVDLLGEGLYPNGKQREGVVVRSQQNFNGKPLC